MAVFLIIVWLELQLLVGIAVGRAARGPKMRAPERRAVVSFRSTGPKTVAIALGLAHG